MSMDVAEPISPFEFVRGSDDVHVTQPLSAGADKGWRTRNIQSSEAKRWATRRHSFSQQPQPRFRTRNASARDTTSVRKAPMREFCMLSALLFVSVVGLQAQATDSKIGPQVKLTVVHGTSRPDSHASAICAGGTPRFLRDLLHAIHDPLVRLGDVLAVKLRAEIIRLRAGRARPCDCPPGRRAPADSTESGRCPPTRQSGFISRSSSR